LLDSRANRTARHRLLIFRAIIVGAVVCVEEKLVEIADEDQCREVQSRECLDRKQGILSRDDDGDIFDWPDPIEHETRLWRLAVRDNHSQVGDFVAGARNNLPAPVTSTAEGSRCTPSSVGRTAKGF
jgi:hypothetical protein